MPYLIIAERLHADKAALEARLRQDGGGGARRAGAGGACASRAVQTDGAELDVNSGVIALQDTLPTPVAEPVAANTCCC